MASGLTVYRDFFFPQMPGLPYALSPVAGHGWITLVVGRLASLALSLGTVLLFYASLRSLTRHRQTILLLLGCYVFSGLIVSQHISAFPPMLKFQQTKEKQGEATDTTSDFDIDKYQPILFVVDSFEQLYEALEDYQRL